MMKRISFRAALLGSAALLPALAAAPAMAQAPGGGSFPGSILIPGTNTSMKVGGYAKFDYWYDFGPAQLSFPGSGAAAAAIPLDTAPLTTPAANVQPITGHNIHGVGRFYAGESRFNFETRTPTAYGEFKTFIEGDFEEPSGVTPGKTVQTNSDSLGFRIRYAYGTLGPFALGQMNPLFRDNASIAETLDFGGSVEPGPLRQPAIRYTFDAGNGLQIAGSAENPQTGIAYGGNAAGTVGGVAYTVGGTQTTFNAGLGDKVPDFVGAIIWNQPWGHLNFRAVARDLYWHDGNTFSTDSFGWGLAFSGDFKPGWGKDDITWNIAGGDGIGRYSNDGGLIVADTILNPLTGQLNNVKIWEAQAGYQHWWTDTLRSTVEGAYMRIVNPTGGFVPLVAGVQAPGLAAQNHDIIITHANLIWSPVPQINIGLEYMWERRDVENGQQGTLNRAQFSTQFKF